MPDTWLPLEASLNEILAANPDPMRSLVEGEVPAIVIRGAFPAESCRALVARIYERNLVPGLPKPGDTIPDHPEFERVDVGTSLGNLGRDPDLFFTDAKKTHDLFDTLFEGMQNPVELLYERLTALSPGKKAVTAREPDGRLYGPAIIRCHLPHFGYPPHIDSVRKREKRTNFEVHRFEHQLGGVILLQSPERAGGYTDSIQYRCEWKDEFYQHMRENYVGKKGNNPSSVLDRTVFEEYATAHDIERNRLELREGDLYFFNSEYIHEAPGFTGHQPRIVLATFFGFSPDDPEIYVWA
ncbi:MAG: hypothetical protein O3B01_13715 [Planctomycetota bacterium]|nr:hypothetical protein [Planctomycetota bacterium]MDA1139630.1 hypothetical protein [Planctomycetota bacterium]